MERRPAISLVAAIVAFVMCLGSAESAVYGPIIFLPLALVPLTAGIGILRRRVWSAYGIAVYLLAQLVIVPLVLVRSGDIKKVILQTAALAVISLATGTLFLFAGRALARSGGPQGRKLPWFVLAAIVTVPQFFIEPFIIPTGAMENTILTGDRILVQRFPRAHLQEGDLVAFIYPIDRKQAFVKRVIGIPGDRIRISRKTVYRNGTRLGEPYAVHKTDYEDLFRDDFPSQPDHAVYLPALEMLRKNVVDGQVVVPPGKYFVLGDNRDQSLDSRYWGFIDERDVIGKPFLIYDSADQTTEELTQQTTPTRNRTRWNRLLKKL